MITGVAQISHRDNRVIASGCFLFGRGRAYAPCSRMRCARIATNGQPVFSELEHPRQAFSCSGMVLGAELMQRHPRIRRLAKLSLQGRTISWLRNADHALGKHRRRGPLLRCNAHHTLASSTIAVIPELSLAPLTKDLRRPANPIEANRGSEGSCHSW
jgi:hypothetical protein